MTGAESAEQIVFPDQYRWGYSSTTGRVEGICCSLDLSAAAFLNSCTNLSAPFDPGKLLVSPSRGLWLVFESLGKAEDSQEEYYRGCQVNHCADYGRGCSD